MDRKTTIIRGSIILSATLALAACGKPPAGAGGPPPDMAMPAVVAPVVRKAIEEKITLVGSLAPRESIELRSEIDGRITGINFSEGSRVRKGDVLITMNEEKLRAQVAEAEARLNLAKSQYDRIKTLLESDTVARQQYDEAQSAYHAAVATVERLREEQREATLVAPFDGVMGARLVSSGQFVSRGQQLSTLVQIDPLEIQFNVPERFLSRIADGQQIQFSTVAYPGERFSGVVFFVAPQVDRQTRTVLVKAEVENGSERLKPGMFGQLDLIFEVKHDALTIPESSVSFLGESTSVVVMNGDGVAEFRPVQTGRRMAGAVEIVDGLNAGELVVVEGFQKLGPGSKIMISPDSSRYGIDAEAVGRALPEEAATAGL